MYGSVRSHGRRGRVVGVRAMSIGLLLILCSQQMNPLLATAENGALTALTRTLAQRDCQAPRASKVADIHSYTSFVDPKLQ